MKSILISKQYDQSHAGDVLLLPIAVIAFWTLACDLVPVTRWAAQTITWCFFGIAIAVFVAFGRLWTKTNAIPGKDYRFHPSHLLLQLLGLGYANKLARNGICRDFHGIDISEDAIATVREIAKEESCRLHMKSAT
jgi:hypothetical protein